jgi:hypothetical protein
MAVTVMLIALCTAVESTTDKPPEAAGAVGLARLTVGLDRFLAAIEYPRRKMGQALIGLLPTLPCRSWPSIVT